MFVACSDKSRKYKKAATHREMKEKFKIVGQQKSLKSLVQMFSKSSEKKT